MTVTIEPARLGDASAATEIWRRSVVEICGPAYGNDSAVIEPWIENRTIQNTERLFSLPDRFCWVARSDGRLAGVGCLKSDGEILACYLAPEFVGQGIGVMLFQALEDKARELGLNAMTLCSSRNARRFYERRGFRSSSESSVLFWDAVEAFPMIKGL